MPAESLDLVRPADADLPADPDAALEIMMNSYGNMVLRLAFMHLHDRHLAEDVSQEVFVRAYRYWRQFRHESSVKTWLCRITVNCCQDRLRSRAARETPIDEMPTAHTDEGDAEAEAMARLEGSRMLQHIEKLPPVYRQAVLLFYYADMSIKDMAQTLGCPEVTVRSRLHRGREALREVLEKEGLAHE